MKRLLALDQASRTSGYAVYNTLGQLEEVGKFTFDDQDLGKRLVKIKHKVAELINTYKIEEVIYEDIQQQENVQTFKILAEVFGVITAYLSEIDMPHSTVLATQWKPAVGVKGRTRPEQKRNAQKFIQDKYGLKVTQDEADAACIGLYKIQQSINDWSE